MKLQPDYRYFTSCWSDFFSLGNLIEVLSVLRFLHFLAGLNLTSGKRDRIEKRGQEEGLTVLLNTSFISFGLFWELLGLGCAVTVSASSKSLPATPEEPLPAVVSGCEWLSCLWKWGSREGCPCVLPLSAIFLLLCCFQRDLRDKKPGISYGSHRLQAKHYALSILFF